MVNDVGSYSLSSFMRPERATHRKAQGPSGSGHKHVEHYGTVTLGEEAANRSF